MHCNLARTIMISAADQAVTDAQRRELAAHVRECHACQREQQQLERLAGALGDLGQDVSVPPGLEDAVIRRIRQAAPGGASLSERLWGWLSPPALAAACAAALVLLMMLVGDRSGPPTVVPTPVAQAPQATVAAPTATASATVPRGPAGATGGRVVATIGRGRWTSPEGPPPAEIEAALPLLLDLPILRNMEKLENYDTIVTTTLTDENGASG